MRRLCFSLVAPLLVLGGCHTIFSDYVEGDPDDPATTSSSVSSSTGGQCTPPNCPVELIADCDPSLCTYTAAAGPNGGDLCRCVIPAGRHPVGDDYPGELCGAFGNGADLMLKFSSVGYSAYSATTCESTPGNSSVAAFNGEPGPTTSLLACNSDAGGEQAGCAEIGNGGESGPPFASPLMGSTELWIQVDNPSNADYWNNTEDRVIEVELIADAQFEQACDDFIDNDLDGDTDCADTDCANDPACDKSVSLIFGCDAQYCVEMPNAGPNGGDLCRCTLTGPQHPKKRSYFFATGCAPMDPSRDLLITNNLAGFASFSVSTCTTPGDSIIHVLEDGVEFMCNDDATDEAAACSEVGDSGGLGPPVSSPMPTNQQFDFDVVIGEFSDGSYWDGVTTRVIDIELL